MPYLSRLVHAPAAPKRPFSLDAFRTYVLDFFSQFDTAPSSHHGWPGLLSKGNSPGLFDYRKTAVVVV
jgi:hypothetical protein